MRSKRISQRGTPTRISERKRSILARRVCSTKRNPNRAPSSESPSYQRTGDTQHQASRANPARSRGVGVAHRSI